MRRYTNDHEWVEMQGAVAVVGISDHAQEQLGDITFVELPEVGKTLASGDSFGVVESVKAASDIYAPIAGDVAEVNGALEDDPELVNREPEAGGWLIKLTPADPTAADQLMDEAAYAEFLKTVS